MKLKEYAKTRFILNEAITDLEKITEKVKAREDFTRNIGRQCEKHDFINGYLWGHVEEGLISKEEHETLFKELMKIQEGSIA